VNSIKIILYYAMLLIWSVD